MQNEEELKKRDEADLARIEAALDSGLIKPDPEIHIFSNHDQMETVPLSEMFLADAIAWVLEKDLKTRFSVMAYADHELDELYKEGDPPDDVRCIVIMLGWEEDYREFIQDICENILKSVGGKIPIILVGCEAKDDLSLSLNLRSQFEKVLRIDFESGPPRKFGSEKAGKILSALLGSDGAIGDIGNAFERLLKAIKSVL